MKRLLIPLAAALAVLAFAAPAAFASSSQITIMEEDNAVSKDPLATLTKMKAMGVDVIKYSVDWAYYAPSATSTTMPVGLTALSYDKEFGQLAVIDQDAAKVGIKLAFLVSSPVPRWAETSTADCNAYQVSTSFVCRPSPTEFETFVESLGSYFSGLVPGVPAVHFWSIWNEPNYIPNLAPQLIGSVDESAVLYRGLLEAGYAGLAATGHTTKTDTILFGDLAPRGVPSEKASATVEGEKPLQFLASLYCESTAGKRFTGKTATANSCPASAATFRAEYPALFDATGIADHPYGQGIAPTVKTGDCVLKTGPTFCIATGKIKADPLWTDIASISGLTSGIDKFVRGEGGSKKFPVYSTEFGYWTHPAGTNPCKSATEDNCDLSQAKASVYSNEAEYISYKNPRIASFDQYQLFMYPGRSWSDGLLKSNGSPEATYGPWEVPLWMPTTSVKHASTLTVWGGARPAMADAALKPTVKIQFKGKSGGFTTLKTITINTKRAGGYFTTSVKFSQSGSVRLLYTAGKSTITGRTQAITVG
jgi:hypothetical protein